MSLCCRLDFFLKVYLCIRHLAIKATCSRFPVNYVWRTVPIFMKSIGSTLSALTCSFPRRKGLLTRMSRYGLPGFLIMLKIRSSMSPTADNCTCWQINYLQYVTFQHLNGFLIRIDFVRRGCSIRVDFPREKSYSLNIFVHK